MDYFSIQELANATGYTRQHIHRLIKSGEIKVEQLGERKIAVTESEAKKIIEKAKTEVSQYFSLNSDLSKVMYDFILKYVNQVGNVSLTEDGDLPIFTLYILARSHKTHSAILALCKQGYGESAMTLVRQLTESDSSIRWIHKEKTAHRLHLFVSQLISQKLNLVNKAYQDEKTRAVITSRRANPEPDDIDIREWKEVEKKLKTQASSGQFWHGKGSLEDLMIEACLPKHYGIYLTMLNEFVHINPVDLERYLVFSDNEMTVHLGTAPHSVKDALILGFHFCFSIIDFVNDQSKVEFEQKIKPLIDQYKAIGKENEDS